MSDVIVWGFLGLFMLLCGCFVIDVFTLGRDLGRAARRK